MKIVRKITNGIILCIIGIMHTQFALSTEAFGKQFAEFSGSGFFMICRGTDDLPVLENTKIFEIHAAFWFFYFGIFLLPLGLLVHSIEKRNKFLPSSFTISYLIFVLIGAYMVPKSGMTYFMLPHALFMLINNYLKIKKLNLARSY